MTFDVPGPGVYGLVRPDGELRLWRNRGRDSTRTWPIWDAAAIPAVRGRPDLGRPTVFKLAAGSAEIDRDRTWVREHAWRPVRFGALRPTTPPHMLVNMPPAWLNPLHAEVDTRVWWTETRERAPGRRALYMPAMPRDELIRLAHNLEADDAAGVKITRKQPIGVWIRRVWDVIARRERGELMGVSL